MAKSPKASAASSEAGAHPHSSLHTFPAHTLSLTVTSVVCLGVFGPCGQREAVYRSSGLTARPLPPRRQINTPDPLPSLEGKGKSVDGDHVVDWSRLPGRAGVRGDKPATFG
jgi:hypothetical protein